MMIDGLHGGGAESFVVALASAIEDDRFDVTVCGTRGGSWPTQVGALGVRGIDTLLLRRTRRLSLVPWVRLWRQLRARRIDILHAHKHGSNIYAAIIGRLARTPVIIATEHSWSYEGRPLRRFLDRHVIGRLSSAFVAVSSADAARMVQVERVPPRRVRTIPTGLLPRDTGDGTSPAARRLRIELGLPDDSPVIGAVCALRREKALDVLLAAHAIVVDSSPTAHLVIVGDGELRGELESEASRLGLTGRAHFLGHRRDVPALLDQMDVMCVSSDFEGSPLALIEAMAAGCGIVATNVGGVPDIAPNRFAALLVPPRDPRALATAVLRLLQNPELRATLGANARRRASERYSFDRVADDWKSLYVELTEASRA